MWLEPGRHGFYKLYILFLQKEKYYGDKTRKEMVKYALKHARVQVFEIWAGNFDDAVLNSENDLPCVISFCGDGGGTLT